MHVASWKPLPELEPPIVFKPRFGSWGEDVVRCDDEESIERALVELDQKPWFHATGAIAQKLVAPRGYDLRLVVAGDRVVGAVRRIAAPGEWRTNVALGARREPVVPPRMRATSRCVPRGRSTERSSGSTFSLPTSARGSCSR